MAGMGMAVGAPQPDDQQAFAPPATMQDGSAPDSRPAKDDTNTDSGGGHTEASPAEQGLYDKIVSNCLSIIYPASQGQDQGQGQVSPNVLNALKTTDKPMLAVATAAASIISGVRDSAQKAGIIDQWNQQAQQGGGDTLEFDEILYHAGQALVEELCEIADTAGIHDFTDRERENTFFMALDQYREHAQQTGALNRDALKAQWGQLVEANNAGRLDDLLPGITSRENSREDHGDSGNAMRGQG